MIPAADQNEWRTPAFRSNIVQKIEENIQKSGMPTSKTSDEIENHVYQKAISKDEYMSFVARLILRIRDMNTNYKSQIIGQSQQPVGPLTLNPMNAFPAVAHQGGNSQNSIPQQIDQQMHATGYIYEDPITSASLQNNRVENQDEYLSSIASMVVSYLEEMQIE